MPKKNRCAAFILRPAFRTKSNGSRFQWQPSCFAKLSSRRSCQRPSHSRSLRPCSSKRIFPFVRQTRVISLSAATGFENVQVVREETTVSKLLSGKGRASASANEKEIFIDNFDARFLATLNISLLTSTPEIRQCAG